MNNSLDRRIPANVANTSTPGPLFKCCVPFAIKFDEPGCFNLKPNIDRGGERRYIDNNFYLQVCYLISVPISFESDCK